MSLQRVHAIRNRRRSGGRRDPRVHLRSAPLGTADVVEIGGMAVPSAALTVLDIARTVPFEQAVVIADQALARHLISAEDLGTAIADRRRWPGMPAARRALEFAASGSRSVGESRSRVAIARAGLPVPVLQWEVRAANGLFVGAVDFGWPALRTVGEFDGRIKYGLRGNGSTPTPLVPPEMVGGQAASRTCTSWMLGFVAVFPSG